MSTVDVSHRWFAAFYSRFAEPSNRRRLEPIYQNLLAGLRGQVVEVGAGSGATFAYYADAAQVSAFEPDPHMISHAEHRLRPNIELRRAPAEQLPAGDGTFDAAVTSLVLCTVSDVSQSLSEVYRVLKPAGQLIFIEHVRPGGAAGRLTDITQPLYGWFAGGCHWNRNTEHALVASGFSIDRVERTRLSALPLIYGVARRQDEIIIARTRRQYEDALSVRLAVFVVEQQIPREEEIDAYEDAAIHCVGYSGGAPVAAGRLVLMDGYGKIGRMSVLKEQRGRGLGARVLATLEREAVRRGLSEARLSAQLTAQGFYERAGYVAYGDVYDDVGIPHIDMKKAL